jgi:catechol 2,3-dioxygenase-like lactoylglutathione lyase family enzyme
VEQRESRKADECIGEHEAFSTVLHARCIKLRTEPKRCTPSGLATDPSALWADHLAFHTDSFEAVLEAALEAGGVVEREPYTLPGHSGRIAFVRDPDGHQVEFVEKSL